MNTRIYAWMLAFYPETLRRDFGEEMALVFADELRDTDLAGFLRVWWRALREFFSIAVPNCASHPAVRVPAFGLAFSVLTLGAELALHYVTLAPPRFVIFSILPTFSTLFVPLVGTYLCRSRSLTMLNLREER
jgi:hypothetical protein